MAHQIRQPAAVMDEVALLGLAEGLDVRHHLESLAEESLDQGAPRRIGLAETEHAGNAPRQAIRGAGIQDAALVQACGVEVLDAVIGAVEQIVQHQRPSGGCCHLNFRDNLLWI